MKTKVKLTLLSVVLSALVFTSCENAGVLPEPFADDPPSSNNPPQKPPTP